MNARINLESIRAEVRKAALEEIAKFLEGHHTPDDPEEDFDPYSWSGGNFDDCYELGFKAGVNDAAATFAAKVRGLK